MSITPLEIIEPEAIEDDDEWHPVHWVCECSEDWSFCGLNLSGHPWTETEDESEICVVCDELINLPCPRCGVL